MIYREFEELAQNLNQNSLTPLSPFSSNGTLVASPMVWPCKMAQSFFTGLPRPSLYYSSVSGCILEVCPPCLKATLQ